MIFQNAYHSGIIFQAVIEHDERTVAGGGRYDRLISDFMLPIGTPAPSGAVGVTFTIDKIVSLFRQVTSSQID